MDLPAVTETELEILEVLWDRGRSPIRELVNAVYGEHSVALHATVKSLLERLEAKGYVECDKRGFSHTFTAVVSRDAYVGRQLKALAESHYRGELTPMLLTLVEHAGLSKKDREAIRKIIDGIK